MRGLLRCVCLCGVLIAAGCGGGTTTNSADDGQTGLATMPAHLGSHDFTLEIADSEPKRETGLMYRKSMPDDHGMIFIFPDSEVRQFYMANTKIPLDIAFIDAGGNVVSVKSMQPMDLRITSSDSPAKYAIEMNLGEAATIGLNVGNHIDLSKAPTTQQ